MDLRWAPLSLVVMVAGCGGDPTPPPTPCGSLAAGCASGLSCDQTATGGPACVDAAGDLDGDGIANADDLCPHLAGAPQDDEDGDGIGDACDRCPIAPPPATPDADQDDVDSPCDPDPTVGGDQILVFDGFRAALPANWKASTGATWTISGGELLVTSPDAAGEQTLTIPLPRATSQLAISARYRIDRLDTTGSDFHVVAVTARDLRPAGVANFHCAAQQNAGVSRLQLNTDQANAGMDSPKPLFATAPLYQLGARLVNGDVGCAVVADTARAAVDAVITGDAPSEVGLAVRAVDARFAAVLVVGRF